jgi:hypothetical protein
VRSLWTECRESAERPGVGGYHVWAGDILEVDADGHLLWTGLGWKGSAVLRLRTHTAATVDRAPCPACGRDVARVIPSAASDAMPADTSRSPQVVLDAEADVDAWQIEYRAGADGDEMIVVLAAAAGAEVVPVLRRLDDLLGATQFIVLTSDELAGRIDAAGGRLVLDGRAA